MLIARALNQNVQLEYLVNVFPFDMDKDLMAFPYAI